MHIGVYEGTWRGTKMFLAPEMQRLTSRTGTLPLGERVDIFAIGKTMDRVTPSPFPSSTVWGKNFKKLIGDMTKDMPEHRPTAQQLIHRTALLDPKPTTPTSTSSKRARRQPTTTTSKKRARPAAQPTTPSNEPHSHKTFGITPQPPKNLQLLAGTTLTITRPVPTITRPVEARTYNQKIQEAAKKIFRAEKSKGAYKRVCIQLGLNVNKKGDWLGTHGEDYKRIQTAVRTIRRRSANLMLSAAVVTMDQTTPTHIHKVRQLTERVARTEQQMKTVQQQAQGLEQRAQTAEQQRDDLAKRLADAKVVLRQRLQQMQTTQQQTQAAEQRAKTAEKQRDKMTKQLQDTKAVLSELRGYRQQYKSIARDYTKLKRESAKSNSQVLIDNY